MGGGGGEREGGVRIGVRGGGVRGWRRDETVGWVLVGRTPVRERDSAPVRFEDMSGSTQLIASSGSASILCWSSVCTSRTASAETRASTSDVSSTNRVSKRLVKCFKPSSCARRGCAISPPTRRRESARAEASQDTRDGTQARVRGERARTSSLESWYMATSCCSVVERTAAEELFTIQPRYLRYRSSRKRALCDVMQRPSAERQHRRTFAATGHAMEGEDEGEVAGRRKWRGTGRRVGERGGGNRVGGSGEARAPRPLSHGNG